MTTDHFQQEVLQRLSVIETKTDRVLDDVSGLSTRVDSLEAERDKQHGIKAGIVALCAIAWQAYNAFVGRGD